MAVYELNPLKDPRWEPFLKQHLGSSAFHSQAWLGAIQQTYGYEPVAFSTSGGSELQNALVFCRINSWMTGRRLVSLPFSDHCRPLATGGELTEILTLVVAHTRSRGEKYVELRTAASDFDGTHSGVFFPTDSFQLQTIDLRPNLKSIYSRFHDSCIRRKIKRSEREKLTFVSGRAPELLKSFRHLLFLTRRRHKLPPQPAAWFENVVASFGDAAAIHVAYKDSIPVASILTLRHKKTLVYKYGCSDGVYSNMGGTPMVFWKVIQEAKESGVETFDLGRSAPEDEGLIAFKGHLGAVATELTYYRSSSARRQRTSRSPRFFVSSLAREAIGRMPDPVFAGLGELLYRHIG